MKMAVGHQKEGVAGRWPWQEPSVSTLHMYRVLLKPGCTNRDLSLQGTTSQARPSPPPTKKKSRLAHPRLRHVSGVALLSGYGKLRGKSHTAFHCLHGMCRWTQNTLLDKDADTTMYKGTQSGLKVWVRVPWATTTCSQKQGSIKLIELSKVI